jgi:hypothetical protein
MALLASPEQIAELEKDVDWKTIKLPGAIVRIGKMTEEKAIRLQELLNGDRVYKESD